MTLRDPLPPGPNKIPKAGVPGAVGDADDLGLYAADACLARGRFVIDMAARKLDPPCNKASEARRNLVRGADRARSTSKLGRRRA
jgi:hypothetical protein